MAIDDEYFMTVGHIIWDRRLGLAVSIKLYQDNRAGSDVYHVDSGAITFGWANALDTKNDFAILHVSTRFKSGIRPMRYTELPVALATTNAHVYGFSSDMPRDRNNNWLPYLSYSCATVEWIPNPYDELDHNGDTYEGA